MLVDQPTKIPTRKIIAVIVSGMIMGGAQAALSLFWPDHPLDVLLAEIDIWLQAIVMVLAGYFVRDRV